MNREEESTNLRIWTNIETNVNWCVVRFCLFYFDITSLWIVMSNVDGITLRAVLAMVEMYLLSQVESIKVFTWCQLFHFLVDQYSCQYHHNFEAIQRWCWWQPSVWSGKLSVCQTLLVMLVPSSVWNWQWRLQSSICK